MSPLRNGWGKRVRPKAFSVNVAELPTSVYLGVSWPFDKLHVFLWNDYQHWDGTAAMTMISFLPLGGAKRSLKKIVPKVIEAVSHRIWMGFTI